jgi:hypothetical protein
MPKAVPSDLKELVSRLPQPMHQLLGRPATTLVLPDNLVCFQRRAADDLNKPRRGRALHHRFVLIFALRTTVTVCVDDRNLRLHEGEGLLVFPFQFHHYTEAERASLSWLFVTFELADAEALGGLRYRPFPLTPALRSLAAELVAAYEEERAADLPVLLLALLLARLRRLRVSAHAAPAAAATVPGLLMRVNQLAQRGGEMPGLKDIAKVAGDQPQPPSSPVSRVVWREHWTPPAAPSARTGVRPPASRDPSGYRKSPSIAVSPPSMPSAAPFARLMGCRRSGIATPAAKRAPGCGGSGAAPPHSAGRLGIVKNDELFDINASDRPVFPRNGRRPRKEREKSLGERRCRITLTVHQTKRIAPVTGRVAC